jgi:hypothetical protein
MIGVGSYYLLSFSLSLVFNPYPYISPLDTPCTASSAEKQASIVAITKVLVFISYNMGQLSRHLGNQTTKFGIQGLLTDRETGRF